MAAVGSIPSKNADASRIKFCATQNRTVMMMISINGLAGASLFSLSGMKWQLGDQCHQKCYLYFFQSHRVPASILHTPESQRQMVNSQYSQGLLDSCVCLRRPVHVQCYKRLRNVLP